MHTHSLYFPLLVSTDCYSCFALLLGPDGKIVYEKTKENNSKQICLLASCFLSQSLAQLCAQILLFFYLGLCYGSVCLFNAVYNLIYFAQIQSTRFFIQLIKFAIVLFVSSYNIYSFKILSHFKSKHQLICYAFYIQYL